MSLSLDVQQSRALLIGAGKYPKDKDLTTSERVYSNIDLFKQILSDSHIIGLSEGHIESLVDIQDNIAIKEQLALLADQSNDAFFVYYTGNAIIRKGQIYLTTPHSSLAQIHVNGLSLSEILSILGEANAQKILFFIDAVFSHAKKSPVEDKDQLVKALLDGFEKEYPEVFFLSASPSANQLTFPENFTRGVANVLTEGIQEEKDFLTIQDVYQSICLRVESGKGNGLPVFGKKSKKSTLSFAYNRKYTQFLDLQREGDQHFENMKYEEALRFYRNASELFNGIPRIEKKLSFINHLLKGNEAFEVGKYEEARERYENADGYFSYPFLEAKITACIEKLADDFYEKEDFVEARIHYDYLFKRFPENVFYKQRLTVCNNEIRFAELVDTGDRAYFKDQYEAALEAYTGALEINRDHMILRRKEDCEKFIEKEKSIRKKVEEELSQKMGQLEQGKMEEILKEEKKNLKKKLKSELKKELESEYKEEADKRWDELENSFWKRTVVWNSEEAYQFYLDFFPNGQYVTKAKKRIDELRSRQELEEKVFEEKVEAKAIETPSEPIVEDIPAPEINELPVDQNGVSKEEELPSVEESNIDSQNRAGDETLPESPEEEIKNDKNGVERISLANLIKHSNGAEGSDEELSEEQLWQKATEINTVEAYLNYINETSESSYISDAYLKISELNQGLTEDAPSQVDSDTLESEPEISSHEESHIIEEVKDEASEENPVKEESEDDIDEFVKRMQEKAAREGLDNEVDLNQEEEVQSVIEDLSDDETLWEEALKENTVDAFMKYIHDSVEGTHVADAYYHINLLNYNEKQQEALDELPTMPTSNGVHAFSNDVQATEVLEQEPSAESEEAEKAENELWETARTDDSVSAYFNYMNNTALKTHWDQAKQRINELKNDSQAQEQDDWEEAQQTNTVESYKTYIRKYPLGNFYAKAMFKLNKLESENND